jgi:Zn-finger nucleic acid-binding protein
MTCPACGHPLSPRHVGHTTVDACVNGCGGIWFDNFELQRLDDPADPGADSLLSIPIDPKVHVDHKMKRHCPRCENQVMRRRFFSRKREIEVDECPACAGVWLDAGELAQIRAEIAEQSQRPSLKRQ